MSADYHSANRLREIAALHGGGICVSGGTHTRFCSECSKGIFSEDGAPSSDNKKILCIDCRGNGQNDKQKGTHIRFESCTQCEETFDLSTLTECEGGILLCEGCTAINKTKATNRRCTLQLHQEMNNKKRPAVSDTLTRRYSRRINTNNNVEQIASLDACVDDIILSIASYLTSCELFNFALTCKRFGARSVSADDDNERQDTCTNAIISNGSRAFARPSTTGDTVDRYQQIFDMKQVNRANTFQECRIITHSHIPEQYKVKFQNEEGELQNGCQYIYPTQVVSVENMTKRVEQSLRFCIERKEDAISVSHYIMLDLRRWGIESKFVEEVGTSMRERINVSLQNKCWSLMEEAALQKSLNLLSMNSSEGGCLMWREGGSWMGVCHQFEQELNVLSSEAFKLKVNLHFIEENHDLVSAFQSSVSSYAFHDVFSNVPSPPFRISFLIEHPNCHNTVKINLQNIMME